VAQNAHLLPMRCKHAARDLAGISCVGFVVLMVMYIRSLSPNIARFRIVRESHGEETAARQRRSRHTSRLIGDASSKVTRGNHSKVVDIRKTAQIYGRTLSVVAPATLFAPRHAAGA